MDCKYQMEFKHDEQTIRRLSLTQYLSFEKKYVFLQLIVGLAFIACGVSRQEDTAIFTLFALFGCWLLVSWKQIPLFRANKIIRQCGGEYPLTEFVFGAKEIETTNNTGNSTTPYAQIIRLVEDDEYCFLFVNKEGAYMLRKHRDAEAFKKYMSEKTGLAWIRPRNVFFLSFRQLKAERKNTKR